MPTLVFCSKVEKGQKEETVAKKKITELTSDLITDFLNANGYELYNVEYKKEGCDWFLRVYIDKEEGYIGTEDCEKVSRFLSKKLDDEGILENGYYLEVSSPGMDRELITDEHYKKYTGHFVDVSLYRAIDEEKNFRAMLKDVKEDSIVFEKDGGKEIEIHKDQIAKTRLAVII